VDIFAAAMGAFALLAIVLLPYYQKEIKENTPENAIADLLRAAETSAEATIIKRKALEAKRSAAAQNVSDIESDAQKLLDKLRAAEAALREKKAESQRAIVVPEPVEDKPAPTEVETPKPALVSFRFLGLKTAKDDVVIALDMNKCLGGHEESVDRAMERIISSLQDNHALKIVGFQQTDSGPRTRNWPRSGGLSRITEPNRAQVNAGRKEIHSVVVGNYFDYRGTIEFMEKLSQSNNGQFMALASPTKGVCD